MKEKFESTDETFKNIAWSCHGNTLKILQHNYRIRIHKFLFNRLSTRNKESTFRHHLKQREHISTPSRPSMFGTSSGNGGCRSCSPMYCSQQATIKNWIHPRVKWIFVESHTPAPVTDAIITGIHGWVHRMTEQKSTDKQDYPKKQNRLYDTNKLSAGITSCEIKLTQHESTLSINILHNPKSLKRLWLQTDGKQL